MSDTLKVAGDLGKELLVGFTRVEAKLDNLSDGHRKAEVRVEAHDTRIRAVEEVIKTSGIASHEARLSAVEDKLTVQEHFSAGVKTGQKKVISAVSVGWVIVSGIATAIAAIAGPFVTKFFFG